jgi:DNA-binding transcriptional regulator YiaG
VKETAILQVFYCTISEKGCNYAMPATIKAKPVKTQLARRSGPALYQWRRSVGMNRETFAGLANFSERTLATYEKQEDVPAPAQTQLNEAIRLLDALMEIVPPSDLAKWIHAPNPGFGGKTPWTLIRQGERDVIWEMIHQTRQGAFA